MPNLLKLSVRRSRRTPRPKCPRIRGRMAKLTARNRWEGQTTPEIANRWIKTTQNSTKLQIESGSIWVQNFPLLRAEQKSLSKMRIREKPEASDTIWCDPNHYLGPDLSRNAQNQTNRKQDKQQQMNYSNRQLSNLIQNSTNLSNQIIH